jgi:hypothetical protein
MPKVTETLRELVRGIEYRTAKETGLQYRVVREFSKRLRVPSGDAIDRMAEHFGLELQPKTKPKNRPTAGPKPRK